MVPRGLVVAVAIVTVILIVPVRKRVDKTMAAREFDVIVHGATGFTGKLVSEYLATTPSAKGLKWAVAGRNVAKLDEMVKVAVAPHPNGASVTSIAADSSDCAALEAMCRRARVVIACAGPFALMGMPLVEACVRCGTHYVDITGEFTFVRKVIERFHEEAQSKGVVLVPCSGFDSVPSDIANAKVHELAAAAGTTVVEARTGYMVAGGAPSGGTMASVVNIVKSITKADMHPNALVPASGRQGVKTPMKLGVAFDGTFGKWTAPFLMAGINEKIVRRTNFLTGTQAAYMEATAGSLVTAVLATVVYYVLGIFLAIPPLRWVFSKLIPKSGEGPSAAQRAKSKFAVLYAGRTARGTWVTGKMSYKRDAYYFTGVSAAEVALGVLVATRAGKKGGVLTPVTAVGAPELAKRLTAAGVTFSS